MTTDWHDPSHPGPADDEPSRLEAIRQYLYKSGDLHKIPPPDPLAEGWLDMDSLAWVIGESGHGKSFAALDLGGCVSNGLPWHGITTKQAPVLYVVMEGAPGLHQRVRSWEDWHAADMGVEFVITRKLHILPDAEPLGQLAAELRAGLVIIDTQNKAARGLDENSGVDMGRLVEALEILRETSGGACVATVHHTAIKGTRPRGSGVIDASASTMIRVARDGQVVKIENGKQREHAKQGSLTLAATEHAGGLILAHDDTGGAVADSEIKVRAALRDLTATKANVTHTDIKQYVTAAGMPVSTFGWALRRIVERGWVIRQGNSYILTSPTQGTLS